MEESGDLEADMRELDALVSRTAPKLKRQLFAGSSITMIGYGEMTWANRSSSGVWPLIGVAPQKTGISIYVAAEKNGVPLATIYRDRLGKTNNGKNCIRFRRLANVNTAELEQAVRDAVEWGAAQEREFGRGCAAPVDASE